MSAITHAKLTNAVASLGWRVDSPYLKPGRLGELIAALQIMALREKYRGTPEDWARLITGDKKQASKLERILQEHPEFFRKSYTFKNEYALILRRGIAPLYHTGKKAVITGEERAAMSDAERAQYISRAPLSETQLKTLLETALNLHKTALEARRDWRWWVTPAFSLLGVILGIVIKSLLPS